jgi:hypothetical protein
MGSGGVTVAAIMALLLLLLPASGLPRAAGEARAPPSSRSEVLLLLPPLPPLPLPPLPASEAAAGE